MILSRLKKSFLPVTFIFVANFTFAQSNYFKYSYGFGGGINKSYTDVYEGSIGYTTYGVFEYNLTPYVTLGLDGQYGMVQGGDIHTDPYNRQFVTKYTSVTLNAKVMMGEYVYYDKSEFLYNLRGLYFGLGVGFINNKVTDVVRQRPSFSNDPGYTFPGKDKSVNLHVPINVGFNYFITDGYGYQRYIININAQANYTFGEGLDGYDDPSNKFKNYSPDIFNAYTIGFRYMFGTIKAYRKTL
ncbi:hypothetical protein [Pedobacter sp. BMA]|uniref:hypothetical protein n=1 Tax=Pedobacter sp. BMA TaxID=1663685 RepID=UPI00069DC637|nr:hypothetical protein [Pedobacter sp. BMA]